MQILIQGDSITWGWNISDWKKLYPYRLFQALDKETAKYGMVTIAESGMEINNHSSALNRFLATGNKADLIIYQWFVNDLEITKNRPKETIPWRKSQIHQFLDKKSHFYRYVEFKIGKVWKSINGSETYYDSLLTGYGETTFGWSEFRKHFHNWAITASFQTSGLMA